jgi:hypothetical protein
MFFPAVRLDLTNAEVSDRVRKKWHGKIVQLEGRYEVWSLEGYQDEGIGLTIQSDDCLVELSDEEREIAELLGDTFFKRKFYTEDKASLKQFI